MVRSIERGFDVLMLLAKSGEPVALPDITVGLKLPRTTAFNIVRTLAKRGMIEFVEGRGYRLGPLVVELAQARSSSRDLIARVRPTLEDVMRRTGETAFLSVPSGDEIVFLDRVESLHPIRYSVPVGTRRPLYCSAHGKVVLAAFNEKSFDDYLRRMKLQPLTERTIVEETKLKREIARIRQQGYSVSDGEFVDEVFSISVPLLEGPDGLPVGMISAVGPTARAKPRRQQIVSALIDCSLNANKECSDLGR